MKKRIIAILLTVMLLAAVMPATSFAATKTSYKKTTVYRTTASSLNVRKGAGTKYGIITSVPKGTAFTVSKTSGSWYKIKVLKTGKVGWVSKKYATKKAYAKVITPVHGLNVRTGPGTNYGVIDSMPKGAKNVQITEISGNWAHVKYNKLDGWSSLTYLAWMV